MHIHICIVYMYICISLWVASVRVLKLCVFWPSTDSESVFWPWLLAVSVGIGVGVDVTNSHVI